jgi:hypothetical protein
MDDEAISGENDVEYAEFSMSQQHIPSRTTMNAAAGSVQSSVDGACGMTSNNFDEDLMFLTMFEDNGVRCLPENINHSSSKGNFD